MVCEPELLATSRKRLSSESSVSEGESNASPKQPRVRSPTAYCRNIVFDDPSQVPNLRPRALATLKKLVAQHEKKQTLPLFAWGRMTLTIRPVSASDTDPVLELWKPRRHEIVAVLAYIHMGHAADLLAELVYDDYELVFNDESNLGHETRLRSRADDFVAVQREISSYWGVHKRQFCPAVRRRRQASQPARTHIEEPMVKTVFHRNHPQYQHSQARHHAFQAAQDAIVQHPIMRASPTVSLNSNDQSRLHHHYRHGHDRHPNPAFEPRSPVQYSPANTASPIQYSPVYGDRPDDNHYASPHYQEHTWARTKQYHTYDTSALNSDSGVFCTTPSGDEMTPASSPYYYNAECSPHEQPSGFRNSMDVLAYVALGTR